MRVLLFNLAVDADDPVLAFAARWVEALSRRVERIDVLTMRAGRFTLPANVQVHSLGKEKGYSEPRRAAEFYRHLWRIVHDDRVDVCFSHMAPVFTVLAAPVVRPRGIPVVTWYAHARLTTLLKLAHRLSDRVVTSLPTSYPYKHDKLVTLGQGIDTQLFSPDGVAGTHELPIILCVGRLSPVKDHPTLLKAVAYLRQRRDEPFRLVIIGGAATPRDAPYIQALHEQVKRLGLEPLVTFEPFVPLADLPRWYRRCAVHVNLTPTGFGDKVAWESMACARPCLVANEGFRDTVGDYAERLLFRFGDAQHLAERLAWVLSRPQPEAAAIGMYLRTRVSRMHSLEGLSEKLLELFTCVARPSERLRG